MVRHFPHGNRLAALEQNILKYRAFEMVLILFYVERVKSLVLNSIRATDELCIGRDSTKHRIPRRSKKQYEKAWVILVSDGIITEAESKDIQKLVDYRNVIAHRICDLTSDIGARFAGEFSGHKYDYEALARLKRYYSKISKGIARKYITSLSLDGLRFDAAETAYKRELHRLSKTIERQILARKTENQALKAQILRVKDRVEQLDPYHPSNIARNGRLTSRGRQVCSKLFDEKLSPLAVAYLMRISYRAAMRHHRAWAGQRTV